MSYARHHRPSERPDAGQGQRPARPRGRRVASLGALVALLGALLALLAGCGTQQGAWRLIGPDGGAHVYTVVADPHVAGLIYAGADDGGVYRGLADQVGRIASGDGIPHTAVVASVLPDPKQAGVIFAGTSAGLYRSVNYGDNWSAYGSGLPTHRAAVALAATPDDATLLAGVDHDGLYRSANDGATWVTSASGLPAKATPVALVWDAPARLWLLGLVDTNGTPFYASSDGGQTWAPRATGLPAGAQVNALAALAAPSASGGSSGTSLLFAATTQGLFSSADSAQSWSRVSGGLPQGSALALATLTQQPAWLYVSIGSGVYRSTDGGAHWQDVATGLTSDVQSLTVTEGKHSGPVVYAAVGQLARYPTGVPAGGDVPGMIALVVVVLALLGSIYLLTRRMRRYSNALGAQRAMRNAGPATAEAERWRRAQLERARDGAPADEGDAARNGHDQPQRRG